MGSGSGSFRVRLGSGSFRLGNTGLERTGPGTNRSRKHPDAWDTTGEGVIDALDTTGDGLIDKRRTSEDVGAGVGGDDAAEPALRLSAVSDRSEAEVAATQLAAIDAELAAMERDAADPAAANAAAATASWVTVRARPGRLSALSVP